MGKKEKGKGGGGEGGRGNNQLGGELGTENRFLKKKISLNIPGDLR